MKNNLSRGNRSEFNFKFSMVFYLFQTMLLELQCLHSYYVVNVDYCKIMKNI